MQLKSRAAVLSQAIDDWAARGLISDDTAAQLRADVGSGSRSWSFQALIIVLGVLCLCFAAMTFVAANWEEIPRLGRVALIFGALWASWGGAIWAGRRGALWWFEALSLLACGLFGAGIMLISQIYHIQGEPSGAVWLWGVGTLIAAALTRTTMPLALTIGLFFLWFVMDLDRDFGAHTMIYLGWWALGAALSWLNHSRLGAHLSALALMGWIAVFIGQNDIGTTLTLLVGGLILSLGAALLLAAATTGWLRGIGRAGLVYSLFSFGALCLVLHIGVAEADWPKAPMGLLAVLPVALTAVLVGWGQRRDVATKYDLWVTLAASVVFVLVFGVAQNQWLTACAVLGLSIWVTRMGWRLDIAGLRVLGVIGFVAMMLILYAQTLGSLIGTAGFYLGAGVLLLNGALIAARLAKRKTGEAP